MTWPDARPPRGNAAVYPGFVVIGAGAAYFAWLLSHDGHWLGAPLLAAAALAVLGGIIGVLHRRLAMRAYAAALLEEDGEDRGPIEPWAGKVLPPKPRLHGAEARLALVQAGLFIGGAAFIRLSVALTHMTDATIMVPAAKILFRLSTVPAFVLALRWWRYRPAARAAVEVEVVLLGVEAAKPPNDLAYRVQASDRTEPDTAILASNREPLFVDSNRSVAVALRSGTNLFIVDDELAVLELSCEERSEVHRRVLGRRLLTQEQGSPEGGTKDLL